MRSLANHTPLESPATAAIGLADAIRKAFTGERRRLVLVGIAMTGSLLAPRAAEAKSDEPPASEQASDRQEKTVIGAKAEFVEKVSGLKFTARVDTGATTCSIHAEHVRVEDGKKSMFKNIGKKVSFDLVTGDGERKRVETVIADTVRVKTSEEKERRYKVWLTLKHADVERRVHVTLNDRSHMEFPLLIGRNFLRGKFLVDVEQELTPLAVASDEKPANNDESPAETESATESG